MEGSETDSNSLKICKGRQKKDGARGWVREKILRTVGEDAE